MTSEEVFAKIVDFFTTVGTVILIIWNYICIFFKFVGQLIADAFNAAFPVLPPISRFLGIKKLSLTLLVFALIYIILVNILAFHLYTKDKEQAKKRARRTSEAKLLKIAFLGGALGSRLGMQFARHKTLKKKFTITVTVLLIIQTLLFSAVIGFFGFWIYLS